MTKSRPRPGGEFKVALVGCGRISRNHFDALRKIDGLTLTAVCDVVPERAKAAAEQEGVASFTSYEEMLKRADAIGSSRRAGCACGARRQARHHREANGDHARPGG